MAPVRFVGLPGARDIATADESECSTSGRSDVFSFRISSARRGPTVLSQHITLRRRGSRSSCAPLARICSAGEPSQQDGVPPILSWAGSVLASLTLKPASSSAGSARDVASQHPPRAGPAGWSAQAPPRCDPDVAPTDVRLPEKLLLREELAAHARKNGVSDAWVWRYVRAYGTANAAGVPVRSPGHRASVLRDFCKFAESHEQALRVSFAAVDEDQDGKLNRAEVAAGLAGVFFACPKSACVYRCCAGGARRMRDHVDRADAASEAFDYESFRRLYLDLPEESYRLAEYFAPPASAERCDTGGCVVNHDAKHRPASVWGHLVAGAAAGAVSRTATAPLETLRLHAMTGASAGKGLAQSARELVAAGGWQQLFRGNFTNVVRAAPQKALDFVAFDFALTQVAHAGHAFRKWRHRRAPGDPALPDPGDTPGDPTALQTLVAAGAAGVTSTVVLYPLEVVRSRLTVGNPGQYRGIMHAALTILRTEGLRGLYGGLGPSVAAILPEAAITYGMFDILKRKWQAATGNPDIGVVPAVSFGVVAALTGQLTAYPLELVSRRMQVQAIQGGALKDALPAILHRILREEGPCGLYRGVAPACLRVVPMALFSFGTYEVVRSAVTRMEERAAVSAARSEVHALGQRATKGGEELVAGVVRPAHA